MNFLTAKVKVFEKMDCYNAAKDICASFKNNNGNKKKENAGNGKKTGLGQCESIGDIFSL